MIEDKKHGHGEIENRRSRCVRRSCYLFIEEWTRRYITKVYNTIYSQKRRLERSGARRSASSKRLNKTVLGDSEQVNKLVVEGDQATPSLVNFMITIEDPMTPGF